MGREGAAPVLHVRGRVLLDDERVLDELWVVDGRVTTTRPAREPDAVLEGWALPGLVDVHCHIGLGADGAVDRATACAQAEADRDAGVLLVRDAGSPADTAWVHDEEDLPRLLRAGRHLARPKRYLRHYARELDDVADLPAAAAEEARRGDGWVKLVADWIDRDLGAAGDLRPLWPRDVLAEAVAAAHAAGARVTAHTFATEALDDLLDAGIDCLEHATGADARQMDRIAAAGVPVTATLLQVAQFEAIAAQATRYPVYAARMRAMHGRRHQHVRDLHEAGVRVLVGTDAGGTIGHGRIVEEMAEMVAAGLPAADVVASASWRTRAWLGVPGLEEGDPADLVVVPADPRHGVEVLAAPSAVVLRGRRVR
ncbi:amidohydrolase family protein [Cellulomonas marina]|uniref:Imidazolonepropionase n=1 Tax=Cellulomonas marina TaxID=988821 RepID=A0A1I0VE72_9CELL|nr:amidohydrolase family protein [Cellulomonas marina]GIG28021.1 amidohydrolase [Cellulomonas marina]SFA74538.1 Imidazolonepropionase [Cellulomonas marina]